MQVALRFGAEVMSAVQTQQSPQLIISGPLAESATQQRALAEALMVEPLQHQERGQRLPHRPCKSVKTREI